MVLLEYTFDSKTDAIFSDTRKIALALDRIENYSAEQREMLQTIFEEISLLNSLLKAKTFEQQPFFRL